MTLPPPPAASALDAAARWLYGLVAGGFVYLTLVGLSTPPQPLLQGGLLLGVLLGLWSIDRFERRGEPHPRIAHLLVLRLGLIVVAVGIDGFHLATGLLALVPLRAFAVLEHRAAVAWTAVAYGTLLALLFGFKPAWWSSPTYVYTTALSLLALGLAVYVAQVVRREGDARARSERLLRELEAAHAELHRSSTRLAELAVVEERNRVARDIHDSLGHHLTALNIVLEQAMVFAERDPARAQSATHHAKRLAGEALDDVRRSVGSLREPGDPYRLTPALEHLAQRARDLGDLRVDLRVSGYEEGFGPQTLIALYRAAQEGITNVRRHAGASTVRLDLTFGDREACLRVQDDGQGMDPAHARSGTPSHGLRGLRERLALVGGGLTVIGPPGQGTRLEATVPREGLPGRAR